MSEHMSEQVRCCRVCYHEGSENNELFKPCAVCTNTFVCQECYRMMIKVHNKADLECPTCMGKLIYHWQWYQSIKLSQIDIVKHHVFELDKLLKNYCSNNKITPTP